MGCQAGASGETGPTLLPNKIFPNITPAEKLLLGARPRTVQAGLPPAPLFLHRGNRGPALLNRLNPGHKNYAAFYLMASTNYSLAPRPLVIPRLVLAAAGPPHPQLRQGRTRRQRAGLTALPLPCCLDPGNCAGTGSHRGPHAKESRLFAELRPGPVTMAASPVYSLWIKRRGHVFGV